MRVPAITITAGAGGKGTRHAPVLVRCRAGNPGNNWPDIYLIATYAYLGENGKVASARKRVTDLVQLEDRSPFTVKEIRNRIPYRYQADLLRLLVGLHKGNVPDSLVQGQ